MIRFVAVLALAILLAAQPTVSQAQSPMYDSSDGCEGSWQEQFAVAILILDCDPGYVTQHDRVYIYSRDAVDRNAPWHSQLNFENAVWVFDAGATAQASLIIDFRRERGALIADIYDDVNGDGELRYGLERGYPRSIESRFPSVSFIAADGWWIRNGVINFNLRIITDGPVRSAFNSQVFMEFVRTDGVPDTVSDVRDTDGDGLPNWQIIQAQPPISDFSAIYRTLLMVNTADNEAPISTYLFWPYLGHFQAKGPNDLKEFPKPLGSIGEAGYGLVKDYNSTFPPLQVNWSARKIAYVGELVASRSRPNNWFIYSILRFGRDGKIAANFENPFAFYDLSGIADGYPDLIIRNQSSVQDDLFSNDGIREPFHRVRFTWDQTHRRHLSYLINVAGRRPMPSTVTIGDGIAVRTIAYDEFPRWVVESEWEAANFLATEMENYWTSEGIYGGCASCTQDHYDYQNGNSNRPGATLSGVTPGFRGDYNAYLGGKVRLYLNAVDRKLHLLDADGGFWQVDEEIRLNYYADGDRHIRRWELTEHGAITQTLARVGDQLVLVGREGTWFGPGPRDVSLFESAPPVDRTSWEDLGRRLAIALPPGEGSNPEYLFRLHASAPAFLPGAFAWQFGRIDGAESFLIRLTEPSSAESPIGEHDPGEYVVQSATDGRFRARLAIRGDALALEPRIRGDAPFSGSPARVAITLTNPGDFALDDITVALNAAAGEAAEQIVASQTTSVPARGSTTVELFWFPSQSGSWRLRALVMSGSITMSDSVTVDVSAPAPSDLATIILIQKLSPATSGAVTASLTLAISIAVGLGFAIWRSQSRRDRVA
ncbi:MAG: hypothetical protein EPO26_01665 [Chloroflexota bacterium]|nr:MAG: hypothetical protein EPO26_01665 [Chloroflexota bacterium]